MAKTLSEDKLIHLMITLKHTELPRPNWQAVANETGQTSANNAQKKFKAAVETLGFKLIDNQIVGPNGSTAAQLPTPASTPRGKKTSSNKSTPAKKPNGTSKPKPSAKKRKLEALEVDTSDDDHNEECNDNKQDKRAQPNKADVKHEEEDGNGVPLVDEFDGELEVVSEGMVTGGYRARSTTIKPDPMTTDDEE